MTGLFPNQLSHISAGTVTISIASSVGAGPLSTIFVPAEFHNNFLGRYKVYQGSRSLVLAEVNGDGFGSTSFTYRSLDAIYSQRPTTESVVVGKRELGDPTWSATFQEILDTVPNGEVPPFVCITAETREKSDLIDIAQWTLNIQSSLSNGPNFWFSAASKDEALLTAQDGNVTQTIRNQNAGDQSTNGVTSVCYSDLTRVQKHATIQTKLETFNLDPLGGAPLFMSWVVNDGPVQNLFLDATQALVQGAGPFPADLEPGDNLDLDVSGTVYSAVFEGAAATMLSGVAEPYAPPAGVTFSIVLEGVEFVIVLANTDTTALLIAANINANVGSTVAADEGGQVRLTSGIRGLGSSIQIIEGTGGNAVLQFTTSLVTGKGNVSDIDNVTLTEAIAVTQKAGQDSTIVFGATEFNIQSVTFGTGAYVDILNTSSANLLTEFGLAVGITPGTGFAANTAATTASELDVLYSGSLVDLLHDSTTGRVITKTTLKGEDTSIRLLLPQVQILTLVSDVGQPIGFSYDGLPALTVVSVDVPTDVAALKVLFDANISYTSIGTLIIGADNTLRFIATDKGQHTFVDESTLNASVNAITASPAYSALGYLSLYEQGFGVAEGHLDVRLPAKYLSYNNPDLENAQRPTDLMRLLPEPPALQHSGISIAERNNIVNGDGSEKYGSWTLDPSNASRTIGTQMANRNKIQTFTTVLLFKNAVVRDTVNFLNVNVDKGIFLAVDDFFLNSLTMLYQAIIGRFVSGGHITPLKETDDPTYNPNRDSSLYVPPLSKIPPELVQKGQVNGIIFNLITKAPVTRVIWSANVLASVQPNLV